MNNNNIEKQAARSVIVFSSSKNRSITDTTLTNVKLPTNYSALPSPSSSPLTSLSQRQSTTSSEVNVSRLVNSSQELNHIMSLTPILSSTPFGALDVKLEEPSTENQQPLLLSEDKTQVLLLPPLLPQTALFCHQQVLMSSEHDQYPSQGDNPSQVVPSSPLPPSYPWGYRSTESTPVVGRHEKSLMTVMLMSPVSSPSRTSLMIDEQQRSSPPVLDVDQLLRSEDSIPEVEVVEEELQSSPFMNKSDLGSSGRRGRPRLDDITSLIQEATCSPSVIRCKFCNRVFPREKSLQAHLRTHTGERPYSCTFPGCGRAFAQSGQLRTHQRLHTGEKPFICSQEGCPNRFTHANRHCPLHPQVGVKRDRSLSNTPLLTSNQENNENNGRLLNQTNQSTEGSTAGKKPRTSRSSARKSTTGRLRTRKLLEELNAVDDKVDRENDQEMQVKRLQSSSAVSVLQNSRITNNTIGENSSPVHQGSHSRDSEPSIAEEDVVWKKKRAALELKKEGHASLKNIAVREEVSGQAIEDVSPVPLVIQEVVVSSSSLPRDKLLGVLALMQLSGTNVSTAGLMHQ